MCGGGREDIISQLPSSRSQTAKVCDRNFGHCAVLCVCGGKRYLWTKERMRWEGRGMHSDMKALANVL